MLFFESLIQHFEKVLENDFDADKFCSKEIYELIKKWHLDFKKNNTLLNNWKEDLEYMEEGINKLVDKYIEIEPIEETYIEEVLYYFKLLKKSMNEYII